MLCEKCKKNEATGHYEGVQNGVKTVMRLCTRCLLDKQKELFGDLDMFSGFVGGTGQSREKLRCKTCGTELKTVRKTLFVGCPDCYKTFESELSPIIKNIQNATAHVGSTPNGQEQEDELKTLKKLLDRAVKEERFEDAAILSRRVKSLEGGQRQ